MFSESDGTPRSTDRPRDTGSHIAMWTPNPVEETSGGSESTTEESNRTASIDSKATEESGETTGEVGDGGGSAADTPCEKEDGEINEAQDEGGRCRCRRRREEVEEGRRINCLGTEVER
jgi:hypothetical protein